MRRYTFSEVIFPGVREGILADAIEDEAMQQLLAVCEEGGPNWHLLKPEESELMTEALSGIPDGFYRTRLAPAWAKKTAELFLESEIADARPLVSRPGSEAIRFRMPEGPLIEIGRRMFCRGYHPRRFGRLGFDAAAIPPYRPVNRRKRCRISPGRLCNPTGRDLLGGGATEHS